MNTKRTSGETLTDADLEKAIGGITGPNNGLYFKKTAQPAERTAASGTGIYRGCQSGGDLIDDGV